MGWLGKIGRINAGFLKTVMLVYRRKKQLKYINQVVLPLMKSNGVKVQKGVVLAKRLEYPYCYCEVCIYRSLGLSGNEGAVKDET